MKLRIVSLCMAIVFGLVGCGSSSSTAPDTSGSTASAPVNRDDAFLSVLHKGAPIFNDAPDAKVIHAAHVLCNAWQGGATMVQVTDIMLSNGFSAHDGGYFVGAATAAYCPQYSSRIK